MVIAQLAEKLQLPIALRILLGRVMLLLAVHTIFTLRFDRLCLAAEAADGFARIGVSLGLGLGLGLGRWTVLRSSLVVRRQACACCVPVTH